jgi:hypothetical protein
LIQLQECKRISSALINKERPADKENAKYLSSMMIVAPESSAYKAPVLSSMTVRNASNLVSRDYPSTWDQDRERERERERVIDRERDNGRRNGLDSYNQYRRYDAIGSTTSNSIRNST